MDGIAQRGGELSHPVSQQEPAEKYWGSAHPLSAPCVLHAGPFRMLGDGPASGAAPPLDLALGDPGPVLMLTFFFLYFYKKKIFLFIWLFWVLAEAGGIHFPDQRWNPGPPDWEAESQGPPGKSP